MNNRKKLLIVFTLGLLLKGIAFQTFGQISDTPSGNSITLDKNLYEHGYNSSSAGAVDSPREDIDTVMVGSSMNYFVMPDKNFNAAYYGQSSYAATASTSSRFDWTIGNSSGFTHQTANTTGTSPWIKVTWGTSTGSTSVAVQEVPQGLPVTCVSVPTTIPVWVIAKPNIGFTQVGSVYADSYCYDATTLASARYDFPVGLTTSSSQVLVDVTIVQKDLTSGATLATTTETNVPVASGAFRLNFLGGYGAYEVTITKITDRIARKCEVVGDINAGQTLFTYSVIPQPETGTIYHVPNNF